MIPLKAITRTSHPAGLIVCLLALLIAHSGPAFAEQRLALVIGNAAYGGNNKLNNPVNDAQDMATVLRQVGFEVMESYDANLEQMEKAIRTFGQKLRVGGGVGLFYFSGHGVQYESENYLIPIGAIEAITAAGHLRLKAEPASYVLAVMEEARNDLNVVILDACRDNPFKGLFRGSSPEGLLPLTAPSGSLIAYSTRPGKRALDGSGRNSPYVKYLKQELPKRGVSVQDMLTNVRVAVMSETHGDQAPGYYSELNRPFCFVGSCGQVTGPSVAQAPAIETPNKGDNVEEKPITPEPPPKDTGTENPSAIGSPMELVGTYRLVQGRELNLDGSLFDPKAPLVKGKLVIEAWVGGVYRIRAVATLKGIGTMSRFSGIYRIEHKQDGFVAYRNKNSSQYVEFINIQGTVLTTRNRGSNFEDIYEWKRVGSEEVKDKYLERELQRQLEYLD